MYMRCNTGRTSAAPGHPRSHAAASFAARCHSHGETRTCTGGLQGWVQYAMYSVYTAPTFQASGCGNDRYAAGRAAVVEEVSGMHGTDLSR
jgi:hypothetical protein